MRLSLVVSCLFYFVALPMQMQGCNGCLEKERIGLLEIKAYFIAHGIDKDAESQMASWVDDRASNCCAWDRVKCANISTGHVTHLSLYLFQNYDKPTWMLNVSLFRPFEELLSLDLSSNSYEGWVDNEGFPKLKKLETLDLQFNSLNRRIFPSLNGLTSLRTLKVNDNRMNGSLTAQDFVNLSRLELLDLSYNRLSGSLNAEGFQNLISLKVLNLSENLFSGSIEGLCKMKELVELDLSNNMFIGQLPKCLSILTNLHVLDLTSNLFSGNFPSFTSNLTSLAYLSLFGNYLQGSFSLSTLANHSKLQFLYISSQSPRAQVETERTRWFPTFQLKSLILKSCNLNKDKGSVIPNFLLYQYDLQVIGLSHNKIVGTFPSWLIQNNTRLKFLSSRNNSFVGNLKLSSIRKDIQYLDISNNNISGLLPKDIGNFLPTITSLNLSMNSFEGNIPASIGEMKKLLFLDLSHNHFSGELPEQLATYCINLKLSDNFLQGNIPRFSKWTNLLALYLNNNNFSGTLEEVSPNNHGLLVLDISNNSISGALPSSIGMFSSMRVLLMAENQLEGEIPLGISNMTQLEMLDLSQNRLFGSVSCLNISSIRFLYLQKNAFSSFMPFTLSESSQLVTLDLRDNKFSGNIPIWISKLSELRVLLLGGNHFHGHIPTQLCQLENVTIMDLSRNMINGSIPSCFKNLSFGMVGADDHSLDIFQILINEVMYYFLDLTFAFFSPSIALSPINTTEFLVEELLVSVEFRTKGNYYSYKGNILENMTGLDLSCNKLTGIIPSQIGNLLQIRSLNLSHNYLSGSIPNTFSNLTQIESLDLSYNNLSGEIPSQLTQLNFLSIFNVSYNNLSGIPPSTGQFGDFDEENYKGNPGLCGPHLSRKCEGASASPPSESNNTGGKETAVDMVAFYWSFTASYITILLWFIMVLCINAQWRMAAWFYYIGKLIRTCFPSFPLY